MAGDADEGKKAEVRILTEGGGNQIYSGSGDTNAPDLHLY